MPGKIYKAARQLVFVIYLGHFYLKASQNLSVMDKSKNAKYPNQGGSATARRGNTPAHR